MSDKLQLSSPPVTALIIICSRRVGGQMNVKVGRGIPHGGTSVNTLMRIWEHGPRGEEEDWNWNVEKGTNKLERR